MTLDKRTSNGGSILQQMELSHATLEAVLDEQLPKHPLGGVNAMTPGSPLHVPRNKSLALKCAFEGCAMSVLAFSAPDAVYSSALNECTKLPIATNAEDASFLRWVAELRAAVFVESVEDEKSIIEGGTMNSTFNIEDRIDRFMGALL